MAAGRLQELLGELEASTFLKEHYEQKCLLIKKNRFNSIKLHLSEFEDLLCLPGIRPLLRIVKQQQEDQNPAAVIEAGHISKSYLLGKLAQGNTLVLNDIHRLEPRLQTFAAELGWELGCYCAVNAYLTPPGTQALKPHFDSHDIFAIQCHGSKLWFVQTEGTQLPTLSTHQPVLEQVEHAQLKPIELETDDIMYLPRGSIHYAVAQQKSSLHLTIGLYPIEWKDLASAIVEEMANQHLALRKAVPIGQRKQDDVKGIKDILKFLAEQTPDHVVRSAMDRIEINLKRRQPQPMEGSLTSAMESSELVDFSRWDIWVQRCPEPIQIQSQASGVRVEIGGYGFTIPLASTELIESLLGGDTPYLVQEKLNGNINPVIQVILETLLQRGILRLVKAEQKQGIQGIDGAN
jgi:ribosomal protein L16 Arg81 hydroxylase